MAFRWIIVCLLTLALPACTSSTRPLRPEAYGPPHRITQTPEELKRARKPVLRSSVTRLVPAAYATGTEARKVLQRLSVSSEAPADLLPLELEGFCYGLWRVRNYNEFAVRFAWEGDGGYVGTGVALPAQDNYVDLQALPVTQMRLLVGGRVVASATRPQASPCLRVGDSHNTALVHVVDEAGDPVGFASVSLNGEHKTADENGAAVFDNLPLYRSFQVIGRKQPDPDNQPGYERVGSVAAYLTGSTVVSLVLNGHSWGDDDPERRRGRVLSPTREDLIVEQNDAAGWGAGAAPAAMFLGSPGVPTAGAVTTPGGNFEFPAGLGMGPGVLVTAYDPAGGAAGATVFQGGEAGCTVDLRPVNIQPAHRLNEFPANLGEWVRKGQVGTEPKVNFSPPGEGAVRSPGPSQPARARAAGMPPAAMEASPPSYDAAVLTATEGSSQIIGAFRVGRCDGVLSGKVRYKLAYAAESRPLRYAGYGYSEGGVTIYVNDTVFSLAVVTPDGVKVLDGGRATELAYWDFEQRAWDPEAPDEFGRAGMGNYRDLSLATYSTFSAEREFSIDLSAYADRAATITVVATVAPLENAGSGKMALYDVRLEPAQVPLPPAARMVQVRQASGPVEFVAAKINLLEVPSVDEDDSLLPLDPEERMLLEQEPVAVFAGGYVNVLYPRGQPIRNLRVEVPVVALREQGGSQVLASELNLSNLRFDDFNSPSLRSGTADMQGGVATIPVTLNIDNPAGFDSGPLNLQYDDPVGTGDSRFPSQMFPVLAPVRPAPVTPSLCPTCAEAMKALARQLQWGVENIIDWVSDLYDQNRVRGSFGPTRCGTGLCSAAVIERQVIGDPGHRRQGYRDPREPAVPAPPRLQLRGDAATSGSEQE